MSFFGKIFGGKKETTLSTNEAIKQLRETEDILIKKQAFLEKKVDQEIATAKKNASKNKRAALMALKRKKRFEQQLNQIDGTLSTIEMQRESLENANSNTTTIQAMKTAADALKKAHKDLDVDKIHDIMDEVSEQQDLSREISDAISTSVIGQDYDEDELEQELMDLEQEELDKELLSTGQSEYSLPEVPTGDIKVPTPASHGKENVRVNQPIEEDDDLRELSAWGN